MSDNLVHKYPNLPDIALGLWYHVLWSFRMGFSPCCGFGCPSVSLQCFLVSLFSLGILSLKTCVNEFFD